jgi:hypothetical protein
MGHGVKAAGYLSALRHQPEGDPLRRGRRLTADGGRGIGGAARGGQFAGPILSTVADRATLISRQVSRSRRTKRWQLFPEIDVSSSGPIANHDSQTTCDLRCKTRSDKTQKSSCARTFCSSDLDARRTKRASVPTKPNGRRSIAELQLAATRAGAQTTWRLRPKLGVFEKTSGIYEGDKAGAEARGARSEFWNFAREIPQA